MVYLFSRNPSLVLHHLRNHALDVNYFQLEDVDAFSYLGFCIKHNNDTSGIINDRVLKARRVTHMLMQCLSINRHNIFPLLSLKLFDKQIAPILHYGAAIWSVTKTNNYIYLNYNNGAETRNIVTEALW